MTLPTLPGSWTPANATTSASDETGRRSSGTDRVEHGARRIEDDNARGFGARGEIGVSSVGDERVEDDAGVERIGDELCAVEQHAARFTASGGERAARGDERMAAARQPKHGKS
jgi:hypothetical protein